MEIEHTEINFGRIAMLAVVATFPTLRRVVLATGLLGLVAAVMLGDKAAHPVATTVNPNPVCNRQVYQTQNGFLPPTKWGDYTKVIGANSPSYYVREGHGTGWCLVKMDPKLEIVNWPTSDRGMQPQYVHRWYEVPSKYGQNVQALAPVSQEASLIAIGIGLASGVILLGIWLPATIMAAVGRRWLKDVRE